MTAVDRRREVVKGAALALAEVERLLRAEGWSADLASDEALALVTVERTRQHVRKGRFARSGPGEGWTVDHDDAHTGGELGDAAACYLMSPANRVSERYTPQANAAGHEVPDLWPWASEWWKPGTP